MRISVQLAKTKEQYEQAFRLLKIARHQAGLERNADGLWLVKQHALPSTNMIVALAGQEVVGALSIFGESAFPLPLEENLNLNDFRDSLTGRIAELSIPAARAGEHQHDIELSLLHFALCFGSSYCLYDAFVAATPLESTPNVQLRPLPIKGRAYFRHASEGPDLRRDLSAGFEVDFRFPEKKHFLVIHQSIDCSTLNFLFNERTDLFQRLSDLDLRVLKNYYDHEEFASLLPNRPLNLPFKQVPKFRRFPMNCEGFLCGGNGKRVHLQVLDVSREGIKIRAEEPLPKGAYPLTLSIGVVKRAEVIASTIWIDNIAQISGLIVQSGCENWRQLVDYLERETLKAAA